MSSNHSLASPAVFSAISSAIVGAGCVGSITAQPGLATAAHVEQARTPQQPASVFTNDSAPADIAARVPLPSYPFVASAAKTDRATSLEGEAEENEEKGQAGAVESICDAKADEVAHGEKDEDEQKGVHEQKDEDEYDDDMYL